MRMSDFNPAFGFIRLCTPDLTETMLFYTELGFDVVCNEEDPVTGQQTLYLSLGGLTVAVTEDENAATEGGGNPGYAIFTDDLEGVLDLVCSRGRYDVVPEIRSGCVMGKQTRFFSIEGPALEQILFVQGNAD